MRPSFLLAYGEDKWRIVRVAGDRLETREVAAGKDGPAAVKAALLEWDYRGQPACLALPSQMVFCAHIDCDALPRKQRRAAMLYRLEEQLPLDIETLTADFLPAAGGRTLGVAVETARVRELIEPLAEAGVETAAVCPAALLALWHACQSGEPGDYAIVCTPGTIDVFRMHQRQPAAWYTVPADAEEVLRCIQADQLAHPIEARQTTACLIGEADCSAVAAAERDLGLKIVRRQEEPALTAAARAAKRTAEGRQTAWIDLRRDGLAPVSPWGRFGGLIRSAAVLGILLAAVLTGTFSWRAGRYDAVAREQARRQKALYAQLYPGAKVPQSVKRRLASELKRLTGVRGTNEEVPEQVGALETLRRIAGSLPVLLRLRVLEMRIGPNEVFIEGEARSHGDAEAIDRELSRAGFEMDPPRTETIQGGGVLFTLTGKPAAEEDGSGVKKGGS